MQWTTIVNCLKQTPFYQERVENETDETKQDCIIKNKSVYYSTNCTRFWPTTVVLDFPKMNCNAFSERKNKAKNQLLKGGKVEAIFKILSTNPKVGIF